MIIDHKNTAVLLVLAIVAAVIFCPVYAVSAEDEYNDSAPDDYITKQFDVDIDMDSSHTAHIKETITVDFVREHHGIFRYIPIAEDKTYSIENIKADGDELSVETDDDYKNVRIGNPDRTLTGEKTYTLSYDIIYYRDDDKETDFLAQNMFPNNWEVSVRDAKLTLTMPYDIDWSNIEFYAGAYGEDDPDKGDYLSYDTDGRVMTVTGRNIPANYGVTVRDTGLREGYWNEAMTRLSAHRLQFGLLWSVIGLAFVLPIVLWILFGRDLPVVETVEFYPPDDLTPAEVGYAIDGQVEDEEMMASLLYFAHKGYLGIEQFDEKVFKLTKKKDIGADEPAYCKPLLNGLFKGDSQSVKTSSIPQSYYDKVQTAKDRLCGGYEKAHGEVFDSSSSAARVIAAIPILLVVPLYNLLFSFDELIIGGAASFLMVAGIIAACSWFDHRETGRKRAALIRAVIFLLLAIGVSWLEIGLDIGGLTPIMVNISLLSTVFFEMIMLRRDENSARLLGRLRGFKSFIKNAEYDRLVMLSEQEPEYFFHILPYASVLGLETRWSKKFTNIKVPQPDWYTSYDDRPFVYSAVWSHSLTHSMTHDAMPSPPSDSSGGFSGGFSGGGFSGGGGGGGGGGAW